MGLQVTQYVEGALEVGRGEERWWVHGLGAAGWLNSVLTLTLSSASGRYPCGSGREQVGDWKALCDTGQVSRWLTQHRGRRGGGSKSPSGGRTYRSW